jgi:hypothetical protein
VPLQFLDRSCAGALRYGEEFGERSLEADTSIDMHRQRMI